MSWDGGGDGRTAGTCLTPRAAAARGGASGPHVRILLPRGGPTVTKRNPKFSSPRPPLPTPLRSRSAGTPGPALARPQGGAQCCGRAPPGAPRGHSRSKAQRLAHTRTLRRHPATKAHSPRGCALFRKPAIPGAPATPAPGGGTSAGSGLGGSVCLERARRGAGPRAWRSGRRCSWRPVAWRGARPPCSSPPWRWGSPARAAMRSRAWSSRPRGRGPRAPGRASGTQTGTGAGLGGAGGGGAGGRWVPRSRAAPLGLMGSVQQREASFVRGLGL